MAGIDNYSNVMDSAVGFSNHAAAVTPHDVNELAYYSKAIYVGGAGTLKVTTVGGETVTFAAVPAGTTIPLRVKVVFDNGTNATSIVALW